MKITVILEPQKEGGYTVYAPSLPGCVSQGETKEEAIKNIKEAIELWLEPDTNDLVGYSGEKIKVAI
jgi:predicted RNase H-like HicB family nuclease